MKHIPIKRERAPRNPADYGYPTQDIAALKEKARLLISAIITKPLSNNITIP